MSVSMSVFVSLHMKEFVQVRKVNLSCADSFCIQIHVLIHMHIVATP